MGDGSQGMACVGSINKYINPSKGCLAPSQPQAGIGIGIGDVPEEMKKEIWDLEYVDIGELLPETWNLQQIQQDQGLHCCHQAKTSRQGPVTNLLLWLEGYSIPVTVLSPLFPQYVHVHRGDYGLPTLHHLGCLQF